MVEVSTSILTVEKGEESKTFFELEAGKTDYFHIDVMDGKFVANNTSQLMKEYVNQIKQISNIPLDVHLMVSNVRGYLEEYIPVNPNIITFHYEAVKNSEEIMSLINYIKENNIKVGLSVKPDTKIEEIYEFLPYIHMVLVMTVEPGKGGQKLIEETLNKIKQLKQYIQKNNIELDIEADGGINLETIKKVKEAGIDIAVVGSGIINTENYKETIKQLKNI